MHPGPEGIHLILRQVHVAPRPKQLQLKLQLWKMRQGGNQRRTGPLAGPVSSHGIDPTFE
jgi:hypothetical protein